MKPDPEGLYLLFKKVGINENEPRVVMIGDMTHDMEVVKDFKQALSIGVLSGVNNKVELEDAGADFVFESINALIDNLGAIESYFE
jgi:phosphoglycolate phosphatase-like HAD superfamily hydrolase